jgi:hypothetical protein
MAPNKFLLQMYAAGAKGKFDVLSTHPYIANNEGIYWEWWNSFDGSGSWFGPCPSVKCTLQQNDPGIPIWFTETGDTQLATTSTATVPKILDKLRAYQSAGWGGHIFWYSYRSIDSYSLVDSTWAHRPAWDVFKNYVATHP